MTDDLASVEQTQLESVVPSEASALTPEPAPEQTAAPEQTGEPMEVVSVDELLERLTADLETEEPQETEPAPAEVSQEPVEPAVVQVEGMNQVLGHMEVIEAELVHPALETPFEDYTVSEGLLLLLLVLLLLSWCVRMIKGGFSWLLW